MSFIKKYRKEDWLRKQYVEKEKTIKRIAQECDVPQSTIYKWKNQYNIKSKHQNKEWLKDQYIKQNKDRHQIAKERNLTSETIRKWLKRHNIPLKDHYQGGPKGEENPDSKLKKEDVLEIVDKIKEGKTLRGIAKDYPVSREVISKIGRGEMWSHVTNIKEPITLTAGEQNKGSSRKLSQKQVKDICYQYVESEDNISIKELAKEYNVSNNLIRKILRGKSYPEIERPTVDNIRQHWLNKETIKDICNKYFKSKEHYTQKDLAEEYDITQQRISNIIRGNVYSDVERPTKQK